MESAAIKNCDEQKWEGEEEEEEALSLCDLPVNFIQEKNQVVQEEDGEAVQTSKTEEDFNFGSWGGSPSIKPEMCAADDVFFKGQILPLRHSVSSDGGITGFRQDSMCLSRSESMDHGSLSRFTSVGSSSTSSGHYSTSSSNFNPKPKAIKIRNNFNTHPSPKPQIRLSKTRTPNVGSQNQRSSMWDFFRLGLVRAPELELQDLKLRSSSNNNKGNKNSVSRNSSCNSSNSSSSTKNVVNNGSTESAQNQQDLNRGFLEKRMGLLSGCTCSVNAVETVPLNDVVATKSNKNSEKDKATSHAVAIEEKKKKKQALSRHRTFEWIKELSHANYVDDA